MKKIIMFFGILFLVALIIVGVCAAYMGSQKNIASQPVKPSLKFTTTGCDKGSKIISPLSDPPQELTKITWLEENVLVVEFYVKTSCNAVEIRGDYELKDNDFLVLKYKTKGGNMFSKCTCANRMIFEIRELPKKDYRITLIKLK